MNLFESIITARHTLTIFIPIPIPSALHQRKHYRYIHGSVWLPCATYIDNLQAQSTHMKFINWLTITFVFEFACDQRILNPWPHPPFRPPNMWTLCGNRHLPFGNHNWTRVRVVLSITSAYNPITFAAPIHN